MNENPCHKMCLLTVNKAWGKESPTLCEEMGMPFLCTVVSFPAVSDMSPLRLDQSRNFPGVKSEYLGEQAHREEHKDCTFECWKESAQYLWK